MSTDDEKRGFLRYLAISFPILIDAPSLSDFMLDPVEISLGGYKVVVPERPAVGEIFNCSIEVEGDLYEGCQGKVAWVTEIEADPPTWSVGMSVHMPEARRMDYQAAMKKVIDTLGER